MDDGRSEGPQGGGRASRRNSMGKHDRTLSCAMPFGGYKQSGVGRENGLDALREYTRAKSVCLDLSGKTPRPFQDRSDVAPTESPILTASPVRPILGSRSYSGLGSPLWD